MLDSNKIHLFQDPKNQISSPTGIIMSSDQHIWFTSLKNHVIGKIDTMTHNISMFYDPTNRMNMPANLYPDTNHFLCFTYIGSHHIGRINPFIWSTQTRLQLVDWILTAKIQDVLYKYFSITQWLAYVISNQDLMIVCGSQIKLVMPLACLKLQCVPTSWLY